MLSVVYVTCRPVECLGRYVSANHNLQWVPAPQTNQYRLLADSLLTQAADYELVVVDEINELPRPELAGLGDRVRYVRPRETPWRALNAFAASVARNTGVLQARGGVIVGLDDCVSFGPDLLAQVVAYAERNLYLVLHVRPEDERANAACEATRTRAGGILAYPRAVAFEAGGYEERFVGCKALEDWEFSERLVRRGVRLISHPAARVDLHGHQRLDRSTQRCCHAVRLLVAGQERANAPWQPEQLQAFGDRCQFVGEVETRNRVRCLINGGYCDHLTRPSGAALAVMRTYESSAFAPW